MSCVNTRQCDKQVSSRLARHLWNLSINRCWSRRLRRFWLKRLLGTFEPGAFLCQNVTLMEPRSIHLHSRVAVNAHCILDGRGFPLVIREDTDIGTHTHIWTLEHDPDDDRHCTKGGAVIIEDHVWVASRVTILPGVTIGRGAVVAAGAVVTKNVESLAIVAGVPARKIGVRKNALEYELTFAPRFR